MKRTSGRNMAMTNTVILIFDLAMLFVSAVLYQNGVVDFSGVLIPTIALMTAHALLSQTSVAPCKIPLWRETVCWISLVNHL